MLDWLLVTVKLRYNSLNWGEKVGWFDTYVFGNIS